jgi:glycosyltransferase involved in cell wall biosynthesis
MLGGPYNYIVDLKGINYISEMEYLMYFRKDLQKAFPDITGKNYWDYKYWFVMSGYKEYKIPPKIMKRWKVELKKNIMQGISNNKLPDFGVSVLAWHKGTFGVGISGSLLFGCLLAAQANVDAINLYGALNYDHSRESVSTYYLTRSLEKPINVVVANADNTELVIEMYTRKLWDQHYNIGLFAWELDVYPDKWMGYLKDYDEIWVPSRLVQRSILTSHLYRNNSVPVHVFPFGLTDDVFSSDHSSSNLRQMNMKRHKLHFITAGCFVFLVVFDYNSSFDRKNPIAVVKAFQEAFINEPRREKVMLLIKTSETKSIFSRERSDLVQAIGNDTRIVLVEEALSEGDMKVLYDRCDSLVSLHRSEGFGLGILQAMAARKPTIATNYGGNADFFENILVRRAHFPISYELVPVTLKYRMDAYSGYKNARWANPSHNDAVLAMRAVYNPETAPTQAMLQSASAILREQFGATAVGKRMIHHLQYNSKWKEKLKKRFLLNEDEIRFHLGTLDRIIQIRQDFPRE